MVADLQSSRTVEDPLERIKTPSQRSGEGAVGKWRLLSPNDRDHRTVTYLRRGRLIENKVAQRKDAHYTRGVMYGQCFEVKGFISYQRNNTLGPTVVVEAVNSVECPLTVVGRLKSRTMH